MSKKLDAIADVNALRDDELNAVTGGVLDAAPLGSQQLFWDPLWWEVGRTGHLPTVTIGFPR